MNMSSKITPIRSRNKVAGGSAQDFIHCAPAPLSADGMEMVEKEFERLGILHDQRALWMAYPNLQMATEKLMGIFSYVWPSSIEDGRSAVSVAAQEALRRVREGVERGENTRSLVVANYLKGLVTIASDVVAVRAWGCTKGKEVEEWDSERQSFMQWSQGFTEVRFYTRPKASHVEVDGTRMKLLCAIASARDVGTMTRGH